ncbi:MAG TPA: sulfatase [Planctomycetes bacterium]|nr:sulfatase [Planctomycetota bacterium]
MQNLAGPERSKPNFVIIFTDDQGYADVGCYGAEGFTTPNLDRMASEGMRFTDFYSSNAVCSPSRASLLTGCYPTRVSIPDVLFPGGEDIGLNPEEITIADLLKTRGYATACIGKWHLGHKPDFLPTRQGFDMYYGIPYSNDMEIDPKMELAGDIKLNEGMTVERIRTEEPRGHRVPLMRDEQVIEYPCDQSTLTKRYTEKALEFITANQNRPFFLYLPHTMPHVPLFASEKFKGKSERGIYGDVIMEIDFSVGQILSTLKRLGLDDNTLVIFTCDNGPWLAFGGHGGSAKPLREGKFTTFEGGFRAPCIMRWLGKIPAQKVCSEVAGTIDFLPTIAHLASVPVPDDRVIDGKNIWPLMTAEAGARSPHEAYFYYHENDLQAVRSGKWKLHFPHEYHKVIEPGSDGRGGEVDQGWIGLSLFDLENDIGEQHDVSDGHPDVVERLTAFADKMRADIGDAATRVKGKNIRPPGRV